LAGNRGPPWDETGYEPVSEPVANRCNQAGRDYVTRRAGRYREMQRDTERYREIQRDTERYIERYREI